MITNYIDGGRVSTGHEPKFYIKVIIDYEDKVTYWILCCNDIRYVGVYPKEPYNIRLS